MWRLDNTREAATLWCHCTYAGVLPYEDEIRSVAVGYAEAGLAVG